MKLLALKIERVLLKAWSFNSVQCFANFKENKDISNVRFRMLQWTETKIKWSFLTFQKVTKLRHEKLILFALCVIKCFSNGSFTPNNLLTTVWWDCKKLGAAPIASDGLKPVRLDSRDQIYLKLFVMNEAKEKQTSYDILHRMRRWKSHPWNLTLNDSSTFNGSKNNKWPDKKHSLGSILLG